MSDNSNMFKDEEIQEIIANYVVDNYGNVNIAKKNFVLYYLKKAINREVDNNLIDFILKTFISKEASINDFNEQELDKALNIILNYVNNDFNALSAMSLNSLSIPYRPKIDFSGVRYEGFEEEAVVRDKK